MKKRLLSLTLIAALCLSLFPTGAAPALAAAPKNQVIYVGGQNVTSGGYWTTDSEGNVTSAGATQSSDNYIHYDTEDNILTLHNATIKTALEFGDKPPNSLIFRAAIGVLNQSGNAELTIELEGDNTIAEVGKGIYVLDSSTGGATLTITGSGSLDASGNSYGILVQSNSGDATLNIQNAEVEATVSTSGSTGVMVQADNSCDASLTVKGGSLTASERKGILFPEGTPQLTVDNSTIVRASGGIASGTNENEPVATEGTGIVFNDKVGTVYGNVTLQEDLTIGEGESLNIPNGASLTIDSSATLTNEGTVTNCGTLTNNGTINNSGTLPDNIGGAVNQAPSITTDATLPAGTVGTTYSQTLVASGTETISWELDSESSLPTGLSLSGNTITGTPSESGNFEFTITAKNNVGSDSQKFSLTINAAAPTITTQPQAQTVTEGGTATFTVAASGSGTLTYQWQQSTDGGNSWADIPNATGASYTITGATAEMSGTQYHCVVKGDGGETTSSAATLTVRSYEPPYTGKYSYEIVSNVGENGTIDVDRYATEGDQVTITVSPDEAYLLDDLTVTSGGRDVALTDNGDGTYTFTMPSGDVAITATFAEDPNWEEPEDPSTDVSEIFTDVPANHWAQAAIQYVYDNGLMTGVSDSEFAPEATTTRAMIVSMLARMENVTSAADAGFADVAAGDWYATAVNWAASEGIVSGISDDTFAPNTAITREQLAAMLMKYAQYKGLDTTARADLSDYTDAPSTWASEAVQWAVAEGLLAGVTDDQLQPQGQATRAQVAAIMQRFLENVCA